MHVATRRHHGEHGHRQGVDVIAEVEPRRTESGPGYTSSPETARDGRTAACADHVAASPRHADRDGAP